LTAANIVVSMTCDITVVGYFFWKQRRERMKKFLLAIIVIFQLSTLFAGVSFVLFHDVNVIPSLSTDFFQIENLESPVEIVSLTPNEEEQNVGFLMTTFNLDMDISYSIDWGNLEYDDSIPDSGPYLPFTMEVTGDGNEDIPVTLSGSLGAGSVEINDVSLVRDPLLSWTRQYVCGFKLTFSSDIQFSPAGDYSTEITINQIAV